MSFERDKQYDNTILHGLKTKRTPALKPNQTNIKRKKDGKSNLSASIYETKPSANIPRHRVAETIFRSAEIMSKRSYHG
mgnify:FL=1